MKTAAGGKAFLARLCLSVLCAGLCLASPGLSPRGAASAELDLATEQDPQTVYAVSDVDLAAEDGETPIDPGEVPEFARRLLDVAIGELGYAEGARSYTKYGEWAGEPNAEWCAEFLCWCVDQTDKQFGTTLFEKVYPNYSGQNTGRDWFIARGRFVFRKGNCPDWGYQWLLGESRLMKKNDYIPRPGDWVFFSYNEAGDTEHVAMVEYAARDARGNVVLHVIEGNNPSTVQRNRYSLNNSQVLGFGACQDVVGTTMRGGNRGDKVLQLQKDLCRLGFLEEKHQTGTFGGNTKSAVAAFQRTMEGKSATGIADMDTQTAIWNAIGELEFNTPDTWLVEE